MTIEERLNGLTRKVNLIAWDHAKGDPYFAEDLRQEAFIAIWGELKKAESQGREVNDSYLLHRARWTMRSELRKRTPEDPWEPDEDGWPYGEAPGRDSDLAAHRGEVQAAILSLRPRQREYIYQRFWGDLRKPELTQLHLSQSNWYGTTKAPGAKAILAEKLRHLRSMA